MAALLLHVSVCLVVSQTSTVHKEHNVATVTLQGRQLD